MQCKPVHHYTACEPGFSLQLLLSLKLIEHDVTEIPMLHSICIIIIAFQSVLSIHAQDTHDEIMPMPRAKALRHSAIMASILRSMSSLQLFNYRLVTKIDVRHRALHVRISVVTKHLNRGTAPCIIMHSWVYECYSDNSLQIHRVSLCSCPFMQSTCRYIICIINNCNYAILFIIYMYL